MVGLDRLVVSSALVEETKRVSPSLTRPSLGRPTGWKPIVSRSSLLCAYCFRFGVWGMCGILWDVISLRDQLNND